MLKTLIYQSFRTHNVPPWIAECMRTVQQWAKDRGYDYQFYNDKFLDLMPPHLREKTHGNMCLITDFCRIVAATKLLGKYDRVVWVDADVLVFDPSYMELPTQSAYCREVWVDVVLPLGISLFRVNVCNAISVYTKTTLKLAYDHLEACEEILSEATGKLSPTAIGTDWLTGYRQRDDSLPLIKCVANAGPITISDLLGKGPAGASSRLRRLVNIQGAKLGAMNLCNSMNLPNEDMMKLVVMLELSKGRKLNELFDGSYRETGHEYHHVSILNRIYMKFRAIKYNLLRMGVRRERIADPAL